MKNWLSDYRNGGKFLAFSRLAPIASFLGRLLLAMEIIGSTNTLDAPTTAYILGPPGTGKTTYLSRQIGFAREKHGPGGVLVASFTKAAATELAQRGLGLDKGRVGTLHSHCYREMGCPDIAETKIKEWNKAYPRYRLTASDADVEEPDPEARSKTFGDQLYTQAQILRAHMTARDRWPDPVRRFDEAWAAWKQGNGLMDFTDLIEVGLADMKFAPGMPQVVVVDEAQDLTRLQLRLVRQWGAHAKRLLLAADDDQTIFSWCGAAPEVLFEHDGPYHRHVLEQSYRLPKKVHALAEYWIRRVSFRENKLYKPREADGAVTVLRRGNYQEVKAVLDHAEKRLADGKTVMFLGTCSYMLEPLRKALRRRGIPFHNPYRRKNFGWNPLAPGRRGASVIDRVKAFLKPHDACDGAPWTIQDFHRWAAWVPRYGLASGAATLMKQRAADRIVTIEMIRDLMTPDEYRSWHVALHAGCIDEYLSWWLHRMPPTKRKLVDYIAHVVAKHGVAELSRTPRVVLGTGHSVKGGEADVVYVFPDLSPSGEKQWHGRPRERDAVIRLGYVMITRAREELVICDPSGSAFMPLQAAAHRVRASSKPMQIAVNGHGAPASAAAATVA